MVIFAFKDTFHANVTIVFVQTKKHTFFLYVHLKKKHIFCLYIFIYSVHVSTFFLYTFPGQAPYTHLVQRHATLALLFAFYSWLAGRHDVIQAALQWVSMSCLHHFLTQTTGHRLCVLPR